MNFLLTVFITIVFFNYTIFAQSTEGFENGVPPTGWISYVGQNGLGNSYDWTDNISAHSGAKAAYSRYENVYGGLAEDWLVTPQFTPSSSSFNLEYYERQSYTTAYGSNFAIKVSTGSQMNHTDFVDILTYGESDFSTSYSQRIIDLSAYAGQSIYVAFVHINDDGDDWFIDDVSLPGGVGSGGGGGSSTTLEYKLTSTGGYSHSEKWMNITTGPNNTGTQVWGQGNGTYGNSQGLLNDVVIDLYAYQGQNLYLNAFDRYADDWDGTTYILRDPNNVNVADNGGNSPDDGTNNDANSTWENPADELESSEMFTVISLGPAMNTGGTTQLTDLLTCQSGGAASASKTFTVTGSALTDNINLSCGSDFEISIDGTNYSNSQILVIDGSGAASSTVHVRLKGGLTQGGYQDAITIASTGVTSETVTLMGATISNTIYVSKSGNDNTGDGSMSNPFASLSFVLPAIQGVYCGPTTIYVAAGTYNDQNIDITNPDITIEGDAYGNTIFDGVDLSNRLFSITGNNALLKFLKIQNYGLSAVVIGDGTTGNGVNFNQVKFSNNINKTSSGSGGAVYVQMSATADFNKCIFDQNAAGDVAYTSSNVSNNGGAVCVEGTGNFMNCLFYRNISRGYGSAVYADGGTVELYHCTASANDARGNYGALTVRGGFLDVYNSVIYNNTFSNGSLGNDLYEGTGGLLICSYSTYRDDYFNRSSISNSLTSDPMFVDANNNDFSLQTGSPSVDAGLAAYGLTDDLYGAPRPQGSGHDMGAYEFSTCAAPSVFYTINENCGAGTFTIDFTVANYGDGTAANITDGSSNTINNASLNTPYSFGPYTVGTSVTLYYNGASYGGCNDASPVLSGCVPNTCANAIDLANGAMVADFSVAENDANGELDGYIYDNNNNLVSSEPSFLQVGNGTTIAKCGGATHSAYDYTEYKDLWYKVVVPSGDDEFTLNFSNVNGHYVVVPYYGTCGALTQMRLLYNTDQNITGVIDNDGNNWYGDDPYITPSITTLDFKGDEILNAPGGVVYLRIFPYDGGQGGSSGCISSNFSTASLTISSSITPPPTRTTIADGAFNTASNWDCNCVPSANDKIVIGHNITLNSSFTIDKELTISSSGNLDIQQPNALDINGVLTNNGSIKGDLNIGGSLSRSINLGAVEVINMISTGTVTLSADATIYKRISLKNGTFNTGTNKLTLFSDANMTALMEDDGGTFVGVVNAQRYVQNTTGHHFLSAPVYSPNLGQLNDDISLNLAGSPYPNLYYYDETDPDLDYEVGWVAPAGLSHTMNEGEGYTLYFNASNGVTLDIEGSPITGSVSRGLTYTASSVPTSNATSPQGWNFVGNPYPSPINFDMLMTAQSTANAAAIDHGFYTWDPSTKSYNSYVGGISSPAGFNNVIHMMQGFWVRANANTTNTTALVFDNSCRLNDPLAASYDFLKSASKPKILRLSLTGHSSECETVVALQDHATRNFDSNYDAYYLKSEQPFKVELASTVDNELLRINSLANDLSKNISIPLMNKISLDSVYTIKMTQFENFPSHVEVYIEDKDLNTWTLLSDDSYTYNGSPADRNDRFVLHLIVDGTINTELIESQSSNIHAYKCNDQLCLELEQQLYDDFELLMYDKLGRLVELRTLDGGLNQYNISGLDRLQEGIYILSIPQAGYHKTIKW